MNNSQCIFWTVLEAIGTVLSAVTAITTVIYFEIIKPLRMRPSLKFEYDNVPPYSTITDLIIIDKPPNIVTIKAKLIRVGIANTSKNIAKNVRVKLLSIKYIDLLEDNNLIPRDLPWIDTKETKREILSYNEKAYVDLIINTEIDNNWYYQPYDPNHISIAGGSSGLPITTKKPNIAHITLVAYAENLDKPVYQTFEITYEEPSIKGSIKLRKINS